MRVYLKIKIKSLAAEAQIIRAETRKFPGEHPARVGLYNHRIKDVRSESRSACLAYGFLRGRRYRTIEQTALTSPNVKRVAELVKKYGGVEFSDPGKSLESWFKAN